MKNIRKYILSFLIVILIFSTFTYSSNENREYAEKLSEIDVFKGSQAGFELDCKPTRLEGILTSSPPVPYVTNEDS